MLGSNPDVPQSGSSIECADAACDALLATVCRGNCGPLPASGALLAGIRVIGTARRTGIAASYCVSVQKIGLPYCHIAHGLNAVSHTPWQLLFLATQPRALPVHAEL